MLKQLFVLTICLVLLVPFVPVLWEKFQSRRQQRLSVQAEKHSRYLHSLLGLAKEIHAFNLLSTYPDFSKLLSATLSIALDISGTDIGFLMLVNKQTQRFEISGVKGLTLEQMRGLNPQIDRGIFGQMFKTGKYVLTGDIEDDPVVQKMDELEYPFKSFLGIPLKAKGKVLGILAAANQRPDFFNEQMVELMTMVADQAAIALENVSVHRESQGICLEMVLALVRAMEAKEQCAFDTVGHSDRVEIYATAMAKKLGLSFDEIRNISNAAILHDMGKIGIDNKILLKPGKLTDEEYGVVKLHPRLGEHIITPVKFLKDVAPLILYHHERYDGKGYPEQLKRAEIPIGARIIAICDAYDAMNSARPYRKALTPEQAKQELINHKGSQFDPELVDLFLQVA